MPAEIFGAAGISGSHHVGRISSQIAEGVLEDSYCVVTSGELGDGIMHCLVLFVLQFQGNDGQAVEEQNKINLGIGLAVIEMPAEGFK